MRPLSLDFPGRKKSGITFFGMGPHLQIMGDELAANLHPDRL